MQRAKVGACAINTRAGNIRGNVRAISAAIEAAKAEKVAFLCLPELSITGYGSEDGFFAPALARHALEGLGLVAAATEGIAVAVGLPLYVESKLRNAVAVIADGELKGFVLKQHLAGDGIHYEPRWFAPWPKGRVTGLQVGDATVPVGDLVFDFDGIRVGFEICEDAWTVERPANDLALQGIDIIFNPSASHFAFYKRDVRRELVASATRSCMLAYGYANLLGNEAGRAIYDGHCLISSGGALLAESQRLSFKEWTMTTAVVDIESNRKARQRTTSFRPRPLEKERLVESWFSLETSEPLTPTLSRAERTWEDSDHLRFEEFRRATALGLLDYMVKSRSKGFVVSLSGGRDSALVALIGYEAVACAEEELGWDVLCERLSYIPAVASGKIKSREELMRQLLWTVYQPTINSSMETDKAARVLAEGLDANHMVFDVQWANEGYLVELNKVLCTQLTWSEHNVLRQNLQARVRVPGVWALANFDGRLLLCTSNRSEAGVGYCTMEGDTAGGLDPIGGVSKPFIIDYLDWYSQTGPMAGRKRARIALEAVRTLTPTAELCPKEQKQTDEGDLMPYDVLESIEALAMQEKEFPLDCFVRTCERWDTTYTREQLRDWVAKWFRLFAQNQWKRERLAVSFHLDDRNLDPKTWCRMPILCALYEEEVEELLARSADELLARLAA